MSPESFIRPFKTRDDYETREDYWNHVMAEIYLPAMNRIRFASPESFEGQMVRKLAYLHSQQERDWPSERNFIYAEGALGFGLVLSDMSIDDLKEQVGQTAHVIHANTAHHGNPETTELECWSEAEWKFAGEFINGSISRFAEYDIPTA